MIRKIILMVAGFAAVFAGVGLAHAEGAGGAAFRDRAGFVFVAQGEGGTVPASVGQGAQDFVAQMGDRAIAFLSDPALSQDGKKASFRKLLDSSFDMETIGRFALGRYWRTTSPKQKKTYQDLFRKMVVEVYSSRFSDYQGHAFEVRSFRPDGKADVLVTSFIVPKGDAPIQVDWRVRYKNGRYRIVDVIVEGVSMSLTQRSDFSAVIQKGGGDVQVLIDHLAGRVQ